MHQITLLQENTTLCVNGFALVRTFLVSNDESLFSAAIKPQLQLRLSPCAVFLTSAHPSKLISFSFRLRQTMLDAADYMFPLLAWQHLEV